jgi:hypothetical protein
MKLYEVMYGANDFVVYKVSAPTTDKVYYGYGTGEDVRKSFLSHASNKDLGRGDVAMINAAGGVDDLQFTKLDAFTNEMEAFIERNDQRAADSASITPPSKYPGSAYARAKALHPDIDKRWSLTDNPNTMTAREAMDAKHLDFKTVLALAPRGTPLYKQIVADMDKMLYPAFKAKYLS